MHDEQPRTPGPPPELLDGAASHVGAEGEDDVVWQEHGAIFRRSSDGTVEMRTADGFSAVLE